MSEENALVIVAGYQDLEAARRVFDLMPVHPDAEKVLHEHASIQAVGQGAAG